MEWQRADGFRISDDPGRLDLDVIHGFLVGAYWCEGIPREVVARSIEHSIPFGLYAPDGAQVGFCRAVTDHATFAWVGDVFVLPAWRGRGLALWLMTVTVGHPELQGLRRWVLGTRDAHALYRRVGFRQLAEVDDPSRWMLRRGDAAYGPGADGADRDGGQ